MVQRLDPNHDASCHHLFTLIKFYSQFCDSLIVVFRGINFTTFIFSLQHFCFGPSVSG